MSIQSYTAATWAGRKRSAANIQIMDNAIATLNGNLGSIPHRAVGLYWRTHPDADKETTNLYLVKADALTMNDQTVVEDWSDLTCDITASGANGLDTGAWATSTRYSLLAIRKSSDGTKGLLITRGQNLDYWSNREATPNIGMRALGDAAARTKLAQGISGTGDVSLILVEFQFTVTGSPTDNLKVSIQTDSSGVPSGTELSSTSIPMEAILASNSSQYTGYVQTRIIMPPTDLEDGELYHVVFERSGSIDAANYCSIAYVSKGTAPNSAAHDGATWSTNSAHAYNHRAAYLSTETPTFPTGYDQWCLLGHFMSKSTGTAIDSTYIYYGNKATRGLKRSLRALPDPYITGDADRDSNARRLNQHNPIGCFSQIYYLSSSAVNDMAHLGYGQMAGRVTDGESGLAGGDSFDSTKWVIGGSTVIHMGEIAFFGDYITMHMDDGAPNPGVYYVYTGGMYTLLR